MRHAYLAALLLSKKEVHSINMFAITLGKLLRGEKMVVVLVYFLNLKFVTILC